MIHLCSDSERSLRIGGGLPYGENRFSRRNFSYGILLAGDVPAGGFGSTPSLTALGYKQHVVG
jgi:hypothetical protein